MAEIESKDLRAKREKAISIIRKKALMEGEFKLSSGKVSNIYIDLKKACMQADFLNIIAELIIETMEKEGWLGPIKEGLTAVGGIELGGVPLVSAVLTKLYEKGKNSRGIIIRKKPKEHGTSKWIEGDESVKKVILVEDVSTTGETTIKAVKKLQENGIITDGVITVVDRGGLKKIKEIGIKATSIFSIDEIIGTGEKE